MGSLYANRFGRIYVMFSDKGKYIEYDQILVKTKYENVKMVFIMRGSSVLTTPTKQ